MNKLDLLAIGEVMAELRRSETSNFAVGFAGDTFNTAVYCARQLGTDQTVGYLTDRRGRLFHNREDVRLGHDQQLLAVHVNLGPGITGKQNSVPFTDLGCGAGPIR